MRTLYIDCGMGAAGDKLMGALLELLPDPDAFIAELNTPGIPGVTVEKSAAERCGIMGTRAFAKMDGENAHGHGHHHHHTLADIEHVVSELPISAKARADVLAVYGLIAEAESHVHGKSKNEVHFHEVGAMDAVADITAVCLLMERLAPDEVVVSPVHVGSGTVKCAHGILPVPAPATAYLLQGIPIYGGEVECELCTPTGAALLRHFATRFGEMPPMRVTAIGYGMGYQDLAPAVNCTRAMMGQNSDEV